MNKGNANFIKSGGLKVLGSTLFFTIKVDIKNEVDLFDYSLFIKILSDDLVLHAEEDILDIIKMKNGTQLNQYYSGDLIDYIGKKGKLKFIKLKVDFRDKVLPHIFDGFYSMQLDISYIQNKFVNYYVFEGSTTDENYSNIQQAQIDKFIILVSSNQDTHAIAFRDVKGVLEFMFPSGDLKTVAPISPIIKIEEQKPQEEQYSLNKKDGKAYIYVASNTYIKALKIGCSSDVKQRLSTLSSSTSVPVRFKLEYKRSFDNAHKVERYIFKTLSEYRASPKREFFTTPLNDVISFIKGINENKIPKN